MNGYSVTGWAAVVWLYRELYYPDTWTVVQIEEIYNKLMEI